MSGKLPIEIEDLLEHSEDLALLSEIEERARKRARELNDQKQNAAWDLFTRGLQPGIRIYALTKWSMGTISNAFLLDVNPSDSFIVYQIQRRARRLWLICDGVEEPRTQKEVRKLEETYKLWCYTPGFLPKFTTTPPGAA